MLIGYARCSTKDQRLDLQLDALKAAGCVTIYEEHGFSGADRLRPALKSALAALKPGDTFVVWKLDRAARSLGHLIEIVEKLQANDIGFKSLTDQIDTTTPSGKFIFHVMAAMAEFERDIIRERTIAGLAAARKQGRVGGRKRIISDIMFSEAKLLAAQHGFSHRQQAMHLGVTIGTLRKRYRDERKQRAAMQ